MKRLGFLIFMFFISCYVRANEIDIKDISLINYSNGINIVDNTAIFNNIDQELEYKVTLVNNMDLDIKVDDIVINTPNNDIISYKLSNISKGDIFKSNDEKVFNLVIKTNNISNSYLDGLLNINIKYRDFSSDDTLVDLVVDKPSNNDKLKFSFICCIVILFITIVVFVILKMRRVNKNKMLLIMFFLLVSLFFSSSNLYKISYSNKGILESSISVVYKYSNIKRIDNGFCINNECFNYIEKDNNKINGINIYNLDDNYKQNSDSKNKLDTDAINKYRELLISYGINCEVSMIEYEKDNKILVSIDKSYLMEE